MAIPVWCDVCSGRSAGESLLVVQFADYAAAPADVEASPVARPSNSRPDMPGSGLPWRPPRGSLVLCPLHLDRAAELGHLTAGRALATLGEEFTAYATASLWKRGLRLLRGAPLRPHPIARRRL